MPSMRFHHVSIFAVTGGYAISAADGPVVMGGVDYRLVLTDCPDEFCKLLDTRIALAELALTGKLNLPRHEFLLELDLAVAGGRARRKETLGNKLAAVIEVQGSIDLQHDLVLRDYDDFVVGLAPEEVWQSVIDSTDARLLAIKSALVLETPFSIAVEELQNDVYFSDEFGRNVFALFGRVLGGRIYQKQRITSDVLDALARRIERYSTDLNGETALRMFVSMTSRHNDRYWEFVEGWTALEILINKTFKAKKKEFDQVIRDIRSSPNPETWVRTDPPDAPFTKAECFYAVAVSVEPDVGADMKDFMLVKGIRDRLLHGERETESSLPVVEVHRLARKYLVLLT